MSRKQQPTLHHKISPTTQTFLETLIEMEIHSTLFEQDDDLGSLAPPTPGKGASSSSATDAPEGLGGPSSLGSGGDDMGGGLGGGGGPLDEPMPGEDEEDKKDEPKEEEPPKDPVEKSVEVVVKAAQQTKDVPKIMQVAKAEIQNGQLSDQEKVKRFLNGLISDKETNDSLKDTQKRLIPFLGQK